MIAGGMRHLIAEAERNRREAGASSPLVSLLALVDAVRASRLLEPDRPTVSDELEEAS